MPATTERWGRCDPVLRSFEPWDEVDWSVVAAEGYDAIPDNAQAYLDYISAEVGAPIYAIGVGPSRDETVVLDNPFEQ